MVNEILEALIRANLAGALAVLAVLALRAPVRRWAGARSAYALWALAPIAALASLLPARRITFETASIDGTVAQAPAAAQAALPALPEPFTATAEQASAAWTSVWPDLNTPLLLLSLWAGGAAISVFCLAWRQRRFEAQLKSTSAFGPALVGALAPRIVLPPDFERRFDAEERKLILAHEQTHLRHGDAQVNALVALTTCLCWFNPFAHIAATALKRDQELACDADVITRFPNAKRRYAEAMVKAVSAGGPVPLGCAWPAGGAHALRDRIERLGERPPILRSRIAATASVLALCIAGGAAAWAAQPPLRDGPKALVFTPPSGVSGIELTGIAAVLHVIPEDRADVAVSISNAGALPAPTTRTENGRLIIDGGLGENTNRCTEAFDGRAAANVPGRGDIPASALPVVTLRTPRTISLIVGGVVATDVGPLDGGELYFTGCGHGQVAEARRDLRVGLYGIGDVRVGDVGGDLAATLSGIGNLVLARAAGAATLELEGAGDLNMDRVGGALDARLRGTGDLTVATASAGAELALRGTGALRVASIEGTLRVNADGSGPIIVERLRGTDADVTVGGSSRLNIGAGSVNVLDAAMRGSGAMTFGGRAETVRASFSAGAGDLRIAAAGNVERRRDAHAHGDVIVGR